MATLKILSGSLTGQNIDLDIESTFIGRASTNQVKIIDPGVSSKHAKIWSEGGRWFVMDMGSTNGTLVNNADIDREELNDGDKLAFGPVLAQFVGGRRPQPQATPAPRAVPSPSAMPAGVPGGRETQLELELSMLKARYQTLEKEMEKQRQEAYERERVVAEQAVVGMKAEMEKLRELMRERDESMRTVEALSKERESWFSPEEVERERKRVEASVQLETRRQLENAEKQVRDLESRISGRTAELEALQRSMREKDELVRMLSEREDRAEATLRDKDDRVGQIEEELRLAREDLVAAQGRERELDEKLKQKNLQLAEYGRTQAELQQEVSKARAAAARSVGGEAGAAAAELAEELDQARSQQLKLKAELNQVQDELITARSARDQEVLRAQALQARLDEVQGELTDLTDDRTKLQAQVEELVRKHSDAAQSEQRLAGLEAELETVRSHDEAVSRRVQELEANVARLESVRLDLEAAKEAALVKLAEVEADYRVLRSSREEGFDWEARYKSQVEELESLRRENNTLNQTIEALEAGASTGSGTADDSLLTYLRARPVVLEMMAAGMLEGVNNSVSLMRRNSEVLKGYVHDCGLLANCVRQIDYTRLEPAQQQMLRELNDETQPDVIIRNMESIGEENAEATTRAKKLILDWQEAMKVDEEGTDLERCFAKTRGLFQAIEPGADIRVKIGSALPPLAASQTEGVMFTFAVLKEAKLLSADDEQMPTIRIDAEGDTVTMMLSPVHPKAKERYRETLAGGGDASSQYLLGFAREACKGRVDVKDMGDASTLFITLQP